MADIKTDFLSLNYSSSFSVEGIQEADINLSLPPAEATGTVYGVVTDNGTPVADAMEIIDFARRPLLSFYDSIQKRLFPLLNLFWENKAPLRILQPFHDPNSHFHDVPRQSAAQ